MCVDSHYFMLSYRSDVKANELRKVYLHIPHGITLLPRIALTFSSLAEVARCVQSEYLQRQVQRVSAITCAGGVSVVVYTKVR